MDAQTGKTGMAHSDLFTIENAEIRHLKQIKEIELECGLASWSLADYRLEIERDDSFFRICKLNDNIAGFILARLITFKNSLFENNKTVSCFDLENEVEIYNIGVKKEYRRIRIGTFLLEELLKKSRQNDTKKIRLEVRTSNTNAIRFYKSKEFQITGTRKNLYTNPLEDGYIMCFKV